MKNSILFLFTICSLFLVSCDNDDTFCIKGQGQTVTRILAIDNFTGIELSIDADVIISQGTTQKVQVTGQSNIIDRLETRVRSSIWGIELDRSCYRNYDLTIHITIPDLSSIEISGSGNVTINDFADQSNLTLDISGSGEILLNGLENLTSLTSKITGSGEIVANKEIQSIAQLDVEIRGSGEFNGFSLHSETCNVKITGSGDCEVRAEDNLDVTISGSGDVYYKGRPTITQKITGSGDLKDAN